MELSVSTYRNECPICGSKLIEYKAFKTDMYCKNDCWDIMMYKTNCWIRVFGKDFDTFINHNGEIKITDELIKEIEYWKENERYVVEILYRNPK